MSNIRTKAISPLKLAKTVAEFAAEKKAFDIVIYDMKKVANFCDFFVICSGTSDRQVRAIANGIEEGLEGLGLNLRYKQGYREAHWVILDLGDIVIHVFDRDTREFYGLEYLWQEAKKIKWP